MREPACAWVFELRGPEGTVGNACKQASMWRISKGSLAFWPTTRAFDGKQDCRAHQNMVMCTLSDTFARRWATWRMEIILSIHDCL